MIHHHLDALELTRRLDRATGALVGAFIADDGEPDLTPTLERLRAVGYRVALPMFADQPEDQAMRFGEWTAGATLTPGRFGIPVPPTSSTVAPETLLVPLVAFDSTLNRMGRGAGFYDRYLAAAETKPYTVGVAFEVQRVDDVLAQAHDVALDAIVTELGVRFAVDARPLEGVS